MGGLLSTLTGAVASALYLALRPIWLHIPPVLQVLYIIVKRVTLRKNNVFPAPGGLPPASAITEKNTPMDVRTHEGSMNNKEFPTMGMTLCPFARNIRPLEKPVGGPPAQEVSEMVLKRPGGRTKTRPLVNLLGGAWIQFMVHDWLVIQKDDNVKPLEFPLADGQVMKLKPAITDAHGSSINGHDHWFSGTQIYGSTLKAPANGEYNPPGSNPNQVLRSGVDGKLKLEADANYKTPDGKYLPLDDDGVELVGFKLNLWSGVQLMHYLFAKEHNSVCDMLKAYNPTWDDDRLFRTARKIIMGLIVHIHTVEWNCAIAQHPTGRAVQYFLWYGIIGTILGRKLYKLGRMFRSLGTLAQALFGIVGGPLILAGDKQPFAHSEEFIAVYRMHALLPDTVTLRSHKDGSALGPPMDLSEILLKKGTQVTSKTDTADLLYTMGTGHAGALELRNYPSALRRLVLPSGLLDMGAVDVWRSRDSRMPLFNDFLKALGMKPYRSFEQLCPDDPEAQEALKKLYDGDVNAVDVMVGLLAEKPIPGLIFGEAIYSIFILMTQRKLESDRFYTVDYNEATYTKEGLDWIENTSFTDMLRRHVPKLQKQLPDKNINAFIPWGNENKRKVKEKVIWDLLFPGKVYGWLRKMGYKV